MSGGARRVYTRVLVNKPIRSSARVWPTQSGLLPGYAGVYTLPYNAFTCTPRTDHRFLLHDVNLSGQMYS